MSSRRKVLPPPKGAEAARQAILGARFTAPDNDAPTEVSETPPPASDVGVQVSHTPHTRTRRRRGEPEGMTRRTYYLPQAAAEALDQAVAKVQAATGGRTTKHEALAALIAAGVDQADAVVAELKAELLRELES